MVTEQKPHLVPHDNSLKFKRANLAVTRANLQLQCYQNHYYLNATAIAGFFKYPGLVVEKKRVSGSGKRKPGLETLGFVLVYNDLKNDFMGRLELDFGGIDCEFGGLSPLASTSVEKCHNFF